MARITLTGTAGTEVVFGNPNEENVFDGIGPGRDFVFGGNLDDTFVIGNSRWADFLDGGAGQDLVDFSLSGASRINLQTGVAEQYFDVTAYDDNQAYYAWEPTAVLTNIEDVRGSNFNDSILGNWADNTIEGGFGADGINGAGGNDTASYEHSFAGVTVDLGGRSPFNPALGEVGYGSGGDAEGDVLISIENVIGSYYDDHFSGNSADNVINGGGGLDTVSYRDADEGVAVNLATGTVEGGASVGTDTLISIEYVEGSRFDDSYVASARADVFKFGPNIGHDVIDGFDARNNGGALDHIAFSQEVFDNWADIDAHLEQNGNDWTLTIDEHNSITFTNVQGTLDVADFWYY